MEEAGYEEDLWNRRNLQGVFIYRMLA